MITKILTLAWKNVWRNPTRSGVVVIAVVLGTWAGTFISGFFNGMIQDYLDNQLELSVGHVQITHPRFVDLYDPKYQVEQAEAVVDTLQRDSSIRDLRVMSLASGLAQSAVSSYGVTIHGIDTAQAENYAIKQYLTEGTLLKGITRNPVVVGQKLADRLNLELRSKMVLSFQDINGEITAGAFRVAGIYDSFDDRHDQSTVYVDKSDLNGLLGQPDLVHNITFFLDDFTAASSVAYRLGGQFPDLLVRSWYEISPALSYVFDTTDISLYVVMVIIIIALVFSIINTMLMAILERTKEIGMLMAVGMNSRRIFSMILSETFFLTMAGMPAGMLLSWFTITYFGRAGINLTAFAEGLSAYGMSTVIYPELSAVYYFNITLMIGGMAILSALYPAWKTLQLEPVEALRKI
ncbi:MAG: FtsX-like permease family protein [Balneolaceae bacterium]|nr:FtsX-like permease family protein [Balneolaceae bacterium]